MRKNARLIIAVSGVVFALFVATQFRRRARPPSPDTIGRTDSTALAESTDGSTARFNSSREDVVVKYNKLFTYENGSSRLVGVTITTEDRNASGRTFVVTGREGALGQNESTIALDGDVHLQSSDGMTARTEHATYASGDGIVTAPGAVEFAKGRMSGRGTGLKYDKGRDTLWILEQAVVRVAPAADAGNGTSSAGSPGTDDGKSGGVEVTSGAATFDRRNKLLEFDRNVHIVKSGQIIEADAAVAHLSDDEQRIESLELHNNARITGSAGGPGSLRGLNSADMTLTYGPDGQSLQRALMVGQALLEMAGAPGSAGRQIAAQTLDIAMAPDGVTPAGLTGRDAVQLTFPAEADVPARTIRATRIDSSGEGGHGLTQAQFTGGVQFRERGPQIDRAARSNQLDVTMQPGMAAIDEARFVHAVQFEDGTLAALAAVGRYDTAKGSLELTGSEPGFLTPRTVNDRIAVDATRIDIVLDGPQVDAAGAVKSTLQPAKASGQNPGSAPATGSSDPKLPSMLKQDQPVTVLADKLRYDGKSSVATYTGSARLFQVDTTIKGDTMRIDEQKGDLAASGHVMTTTIRDAKKEGADPKDPKKPKDPKDPDKKTDRQQTIGTSTEMAYEDATRKLTYIGAAHLVGPAGDLSAEKIELFLNPSGDDVDRAEGYAAPDKTLTLHETNRTTTGARLTYTAERETYVVTGLPATLIDECARETVGKTLTWLRSTDTIVVDGNQQVRTRTKSAGRCP